MADEKKGFLNKFFELLQWLVLGHVYIGRGTITPPPDGMGEQREGIWERITEMFPSLSREDERGLGSILLRFFNKAERRSFYSEFGENYVSQGYDFKRLLIDVWKLYEDHKSLGPNENPALVLIRDIIYEDLIEDQIDLIKNTGIIVKLSVFHDLVEYRVETGLILLLLLLSVVLCLVVVFWSMVSPTGSIWNVIFRA